MPPALERIVRRCLERRPEERFQTAIKENPRDVSRVLAYVRWLLERGEYDRAVAPLRQALRLDPRNVEAVAALRRAAKALSRPALLRELEPQHAEAPR